MSQTASAPVPEPIALHSPAGQDTINVESSPPSPQPGPVPASALVVESTAIPTVTVAPEFTATLTDPAVTPTFHTVTLTAAPVPTPTLSQPTSLSTPVVNKDQVQTAALPQTTEVVNMTAADSFVLAKESKVAPDSPASAAEPMNALTSKFTDREWAALKELRDKFPDTLAKAFPDDEDARSTPVTIWGVTINPNNMLADPCVSVILMKFLRARNLSIGDACDQLVGTLRWRESFNIKAALEEDFPQSIFGNLAHISGTDKEGRLVVYNIYGGNQDLKAVFGDVQRFIRWRVALMERSVMQLDFTTLDQMIQVHDYEGVSLTSRDANSKAAATEATNIFQNHYPEMLYKKFFINVPTLLNWIFWIFKPLISANTLAKMFVVGTGQHSIKKALSEYIPSSQIPARYGGEGETF